MSKSKDKRTVERAFASVERASIAELQYRLVKGISQSMVEELLYKTQPWKLDNGVMAHQELPRGTAAAAKRALKMLQERLKAELDDEVE